MNIPLEYRFDRLLAIDILQKLRNMHQSGSRARVKELAQSFGVTGGVFSAAAKTSKAKTLHYLFNVSAIRRDSPKGDIYLVRPFEELEAEFTKWARPAGSAEEPESHCLTVNTPKEAEGAAEAVATVGSDAKSISIKVKDVIITINFSHHE